MMEPATETLNSNSFWQFQNRAKRLVNDKNPSGTSGFWPRVLSWLTRDPLPVRLLRERVTALETERDRLLDILTQAYERSGVIPRQPEHRGPPPPPQEQRKTLGEMNAEYLEEEARRYEQWKAEEAAMIKDEESEAKPS